MATPIPRNEARFSADDVVRATGGQVAGPTWSGATGVVTDSRAVCEGNLFVALAGEQFDGHAFVNGAVDAGAAAVLVERPVADALCAVVVPDTLVALGDLARAHRVSWPGRVIAITGSAGKTTTKELIGAVARGAGESVLQTAGNLNNRIGVPMTLLQLDRQHTVAVVEMGTNAPGEIGTLALIARPNVAVLTLVSEAHTEGLGSLEAVAREKTSLFEAIDETGCIVALGDDDRIRAATAVSNAKEYVFFGSESRNDVQLVDSSVSTAGTTCVYRVRGQNFTARLKLLGQGAALGGAAALGVALALHFDVERAAASLADVSSIPGRLCLRELGGVCFVDDSYNANPASTRVAIDTASKLATSEGRRFVVVLGDMKELGAASEAAHREVAAQLMASNVAYALFCGDEMQHAFAATGAGGVACDWFDDVSSISDEALDRIEEGDLVLVKGSRSMEMERVIDVLTAGRESR